MVSQSKTQKYDKIVERLKETIQLGKELAFKYEKEGKKENAKFYEGQVNLALDILNGYENRSKDVWRKWFASSSLERAKETMENPKKL